MSTTIEDKWQALTGILAVVVIAAALATLASVVLNIDLIGWLTK
jgi:hypothetical protein